MAEDRPVPGTATSKSDDEGGARDKVSVQVSRDVHKRFQKVAEDRGFGVGKLVDRALAKYADELEKLPPLP